MKDDRSSDEILADGSHPIWRIIATLVGVLAGIYGYQNLM